MIRKENSMSPTCEDASKSQCVLTTEAVNPGSAVPRGTETDVSEHSINGNVIAEEVSHRKICYFWRRLSALNSFSSLTHTAMY